MKPDGHVPPDGVNGGVDGIRKLAIPLAIVIVVFVALVVVSVIVLQRRVNAFCDSTFDTRRLFALVLTSVATDESDTPSDDARQRAQADRIEPLLTDLPDQCAKPANMDLLRIRVDGN